MEFTIDGVNVTTDLEDMTEAEARKYIRYVEENVNFNRETHYISDISVTLCDDGKIELDYCLKDTRKFERIRRITGYLTGTLNTWNNAKRVEESERVKHGIRDFLEG